MASYVLHLLPALLAEGRLVGRVREVATGRTGTLRDLDDLTAFCAAGGSRTPGPGDPASEGAPG